jgi:hypothetical protein
MNNDKRQISFAALAHVRGDATMDHRAQGFRDKR